METNPTKRSLIGQSLSFAFDALVGNVGAWIGICLTIFGFAIVGWAIMVALSMSMGVIDCISPSACFSLMTGERIYYGFIAHDTPLIITASIAMTLFYIIYAESMVLGLIHTMIQFYTTGQIHFRPCLKFDSIISFIAAGFILLPLIIGGLILLIVPGIIVIMRSFFVGYYIVDKNLGPIEAIKASWELTRGKSSTMLGLLFMYFLLNCIPIIGWLITGLMVVYMYESLGKEAPQL